MSCRHSRFTKPAPDNSYKNTGMEPASRNTMHITQYPIQVYKDFEKAVGGSEPHFQKLLDDGYPEWAAFAHGLQGDKEAVMWLLKSPYPEFGVLANGMADEPGAIAWLKNIPDPFFYVFCQATKKDSKAIQWLEEHKLYPILIIADAIRKAVRLRNKRETFWYKIDW